MRSTLSIIKNIEFVVVILVMLFSASSGFSASILFDNTKNETAGNADWIIDNDQPIPIPGSPSSPDDWMGAYSAWGYRLWQEGHTLRTLSGFYDITYNNPANPYDLSGFDVFIVPEPQNNFTPDERTAILNFVYDGGGLFIIANHNASDRDNDGVDSLHVWNNFGVKQYFGLKFDERQVSDTSSNRNLSHPIIANSNYGSVETVKFYAGTTMSLYPAENPTVEGVFWLSSASQGDSDVMIATAEYGAGRVVAIGDSSPADDGTGTPGNNLYPNWYDAEATHPSFFLSAVDFLLGVSVSNSPPSIEDVEIRPYSPTVNSYVTVSAMVKENTGLVDVVRAYYQVSSSSGEFTTLTMTLVSGTATEGIWQTVESIPPQPVGTTVYYYIEATDDRSPPATAYAPADAPAHTFHYTVSEFSPIDLSGWQLIQEHSHQEFTFPAGTILQPNGYLIVARNAEKDAFENFWGVLLPENCVFINAHTIVGGYGFPQINGDETFKLLNNASQLVDGETIAIARGQSIQRRSPSAPAGDPESWDIRPAHEATPGSGAGTLSGAGVVINEFSDAEGTGNYVYEFVELFFDAGDIAPELFSISENSNGKLLTTSDTLTVSIRGTPGCQAWFTLEGAVTDLPMTEYAPGNYTGTYVVQPATQVHAQPVRGKLENEYAYSELATTTTVSIDAGEVCAQYLFDADTEEWTTGGVPGVFTIPASSYQEGSLVLTATDNTNTFGYWHSPFAVPLRGDSIYRVRATLRSDVTDARQSPTFRLRLSTDDFQQTTCYLVESRGDAWASPDVQGKDYDYYYVPQHLVADGKTLELAFDLLNFSPDDTATASLALDEISIERMPLIVLTSESLVVSYDFNTDTQGWYCAGAPSRFTEPECQWSSAGMLSIKPLDNTNTFGYWNSPLISPMLPDALYRARFSLLTDYDIQGELPGLRMRFLTADYQQSGMLRLESWGNAEGMPTTSPRDYAVYFQPYFARAHTSINGFYIALDLFNFNSSDTISATYYIDNVVVSRVGIPPFP
ncbi:lamin tail domain-containing protein [Candidatus Sumerlaeota bacterium]|nr:lamin tail domain-containing protein [Candidatus Sumerlaeota bacterium]